MRKKKIYIVKETERNTVRERDRERKTNNLCMHRKQTSDEEREK